MSDITELKTRLMTWDWQSPDVRALREDHDRLERLVADMRKAGDGLRDSSFAVIEELRAQITELERYKKAFEWLESVVNECSKAEIMIARRRDGRVYFSDGLGELRGEGVTPLEAIENAIRRKHDPNFFG